MCRPGAQGCGCHFCCCKVACGACLSLCFSSHCSGRRRSENRVQYSRGGARIDQAAIGNALPLQRRLVPGGIVRAAVVQRPQVEGQTDTTQRLGVVLHLSWRVRVLWGPRAAARKQVAWLLSVRVAIASYLARLRPFDHGPVRRGAALLMARLKAGVRNAESPDAQLATGEAESSVVIGVPKGCKIADSEIGVRNRPILTAGSGPERGQDIGRRPIWASF